MVTNTYYVIIGSRRTLATISRILMDHSIDFFYNDMTQEIEFIKPYYSNVMAVIKTKVSSRMWEVQCELETEKKSLMTLLKTGEL